jgi:lipoprotein-anchoring transpeptidase ErfK/SrfK
MTRAAAGLALAALAGSVAGCGGEGLSASGTPGPANAPQTPAPALTAVPAKPKPRVVGPPGVPGVGTLTAYVAKAKVLRVRPGGRPLALMKRRTEWRSVRVVTVVRRQGNWLGVLASELRNSRVGWIDGRRDVKLFRTPWSLVTDLSARTVTVRHNGRVVRRLRVAIGSPSAPTPTGRFAVTDKLTTGSDNGPYGCCILALTGHQPLIPQGWGGGDRIALHATPSPETIGQAASHGCLRATNQVMARLVRQVPLGTRMTIQR